MQLDLEVLTPLHIGVGRALSPMEYWIGDDFCRIRMESLFRDRDFLPYLEPFLQGAASERYLGRYIPEELLRRHVQYAVRLSPRARDHLVQHQVQIKECVKSAGRPFIPGSSIKGSILSAVANHVLTEMCKQPRQREIIVGLLRNPRDSRNFTQLLDLCFGDLRAEEARGQHGRFFNWLQVGDSNLSKPEEALMVFFSQVEGAKTGSKLPILLEGFACETSWRFSLLVSRESRFQNRDILQMVDRFYRKVWGKTLKEMNPPRDGTLMRLGHGSSAWSTSLLLLAEDEGIAEYPVRPPRTRKTVDPQTSMGWVVLTAAGTEKLPPDETHSRGPSVVKEQFVTSMRPHQASESVVLEPLIPPEFPTVSVAGPNDPIPSVVKRDEEAAWLREIRETELIFVNPQGKEILRKRKAYQGSPKLLLVGDWFILKGTNESRPLP